MKITKAWIKRWEPCKEAVDWLAEQDTKDVFELIRRLRKSDVDKKYSWLFWAIPRLLQSKRDRVKFAVYAARLVLRYWEEKYPEDRRPRQAIEMAKKWLKHPTKKNAEAAAAATAAYVTAIAASDAAYAATNAAANAASNAAAAANTAYAAAIAAYVTATAASDAAYAATNAVANTASNAAYAADAADSAAFGVDHEKIRKKIIDYGIQLLRQRKTVAEHMSEVKEQSND